VRVPTNAPLSHLHTHTHDPHECTRTHTHTHARTLQATAKHTRPRTCQCAHTLSRAHTQTHNATRSLARMGAHAPAHPARWTTCADELLQLRQPLEAQGVELQQLRLSTAALFAAAEATASRNRDTSTLRKQRAIKSATNDTTGWPSCSKSGRKGQDGHLRLRLTEPAVTEAQSEGSPGAPPCQHASLSEWAHMNEFLAVATEMTSGVQTRAGAGTEQTLRRGQHCQPDSEPEWGRGTTTAAAAAAAATATTTTSKCWQSESPGLAASD
jgi:hypothetical protein